MPPHPAGSFLECRPEGGLAAHQAESFLASEREGCLPPHPAGSFLGSRLESCLAAHQAGSLLDCEVEGSRDECQARAFERELEGPLDHYQDGASQKGREESSMTPHQAAAPLDVRWDRALGPNQAVDLQERRLGGSLGPCQDETRLGGSLGPCQDDTSLESSRPGECEGPQQYSDSPVRVLPRGSTLQGGRTVEGESTLQGGCTLRGGNMLQGGSKLQAGSTFQGGRTLQGQGASRHACSKQTLPSSRGPWVVSLTPWLLLLCLMGPPACASQDKSVVTSHTSHLLPNGTRHPLPRSLVAKAVGGFAPFTPRCRPMADPPKGGESPPPL